MPRRQHLRINRGRLRALPTTLRIPWESDFLGTSPRQRGLVTFCLAQLNLISPQEFSLKTGQLLRILANHPEGLPKRELIQALYPQFHLVSPEQQSSLTACAAKVIQRARARYLSLGLSIEFSRATGRFSVELGQSHDGGKNNPKRFFVAR